MIELDTIVNAECLAHLRTMPDECLDCVITSPPYYGLRDYGCDGQVGLEDTPEMYTAKLVEIFHEVKRCLKPEGTCWLNLGDSYANKSLIGIPWMVAFALRADGWYLRQDIIWAKPNPMPESVKDRCTKSHEYIFLLTKSPKYYFDYEAIQEEATGYDGRKDTVLKGSPKYKDANIMPHNQRQSLAAGKHERWKFKNIADKGQQPNTMHLRRAYGVEQFLDCLRFEPPKPGHSIHVITGGNVDMICYLKYLLLHYSHMRRVVVTTWCLGGSEILMLEQWHKEGRIDLYDMYTGEHCKQQYKVEWAKLERMKDAGIVRRLVCSTIHCKLILCDTDTEKVVVETSSNFNMNPRIEQGCVTVNAELFDFYDSYLAQLVHTGGKVHI